MRCEGHHWLISWFRHWAFTGLYRQSLAAAGARVWALRRRRPMCRMTADVGRRLMNRSAGAATAGPGPPVSSRLRLAGASPPAVECVNARNVNDRGFHVPFPIRSNEWNRFSRDNDRMNGHEYSEMNNDQMSITEWNGSSRGMGMKWNDNSHRGARLIVSRGSFQM